MQPLLQSNSNKYYIFWVCVCCLSYPACNAHPPYCHLWPVRLCLGKGVIECKMCASIFSTTFIWNISHSKENWIRYDKKMCICLPVKYPLFMSELEFSGQIFRKILKYEISWKSVQWEPSCSMQTDRQTDRSERSSFAVLRKRLKTRHVASTAS
jgi:hypothetical protein